MRSESFNFKDNDVSNIDVVVEAIHELVSPCIIAFEMIMFAYKSKLLVIYIDVK